MDSERSFVHGFGDNFILDVFVSILDINIILNKYTYGLQINDCSEWLWLKIQLKYSYYQYPKVIVMSHLASLYQASLSILTQFCLNIMHWFMTYKLMF